MICQSKMNNLVSCSSPRKVESFRYKSRIEELMSEVATLRSEKEHWQNQSDRKDSSARSGQEVQAELELWKQRTAAFEKEIKEVQRWKTQAKAFEKEAKDALRWKVTKTNNCYS